MSAGAMQIVDVTLREGLQGADVQPPVEGKLELLRTLAELGVEAFDIGFPGASAQQFEDACVLAKAVVEERLPVSVTVLCRTVRGDIEAAVRVAQQTGCRLGVMAFIGASPIRCFVEGWDRAFLHRMAQEAVEFAVREQLPVLFATEDTTRADPAVVRDLYGTAVACGATLVAIADTVGYAVPRAAAAVVRCVREAVGPSVVVDWHGHADRGLDLANALAAVEAGADRVHSSLLGLGERAGNTATEDLLRRVRGLAPGSVEEARLEALEAKARVMFGLQYPSTRTWTVRDRRRSRREVPGEGGSAA